MKIRLPGGEEMDIEAGQGESVAGRTGGGIMGPCRGHGRCGMCVVSLIEGADGIDAPSEAEARVLRILGARPSQRLACQARGK
jgi:adenylate cyclase